MSKISSLFYYNLAMTSSEAAKTAATATTTPDSDLIDERFDLLIDTNGNNRHSNKDRCAMTSTFSTGTTTATTTTTYNAVKPTYNGQTNHWLMDEKFTSASGTAQTKTGGGADTTCFKEDLDDYFPTLRILPATPSSTATVQTTTAVSAADYFSTSTDNSNDNNSSSSNNNIDEVIDIEPATSTAADKNSTATRTAEFVFNHGRAAPASLDAYHSGLVEHYLDIVFERASATSDTLHKTLPRVYKNYLDSIHQYYL